MIQKSILAFLLLIYVQFTFENENKNKNSNFFFKGRIEKTSKVSEIFIFSAMSVTRLFLLIFMYE